MYIGTHSVDIICRYLRISFALYFKGVDFGDMSRVLNQWLNASYPDAALPCEMWSVEELQELQAVLLTVARDAQFDDIYRETGDNRRLRHHLLRVSKATLELTKERG